MVKLGTFVALGVRGVKSLRIGVLTWVSFMLKWVKQIGICRISKSRFWEIQECVSLWF